MTAMLAGSKGPKKPHTPRESPDSIRSIARAKMLLALGEGEWVDGVSAQDIYLDGTPLADENGNLNFPGCRWEFRSGTPDQEYIQGMPAVESETNVGVELSSATPWVRSITNTQLSAVRLRVAWPVLMHTKDNGDRVGTKVEYRVELSTDSGVWETVVDGVINDKTTTLYERSHRIDLPEASSGWRLRVTRLTPDSENLNTQNKMQIQAITEIIDAKLRYPNTALLYIEFDASQFQSVPTVAVETRMRIIRVPSNYDPDSRQYSGLWDGTFKWGWTDNPAWVMYDLITSERFGLGRRIDASMVDKWALYQIGQYCDQLVPDGEGGQEPRFTCNVYIQSSAQAWDVLRDIAAIFRGMSYWSASSMVTLADMPRDVDYLYTRANVIDGRFEYAGSSPLRERYSQAVVSFDSPDIGYDSEVEVVSDPALVRRYGINKLELTAIGCTRRSEAQRRGKWALLTASQDRVVSFSVGLDGSIPLPGHIIGVADTLLAGRPLGGRVAAVAGRVITLDRDSAVKAGDRLRLNLPDGKSEARSVQAVSGRAVTVTTAYSQAPEVECAWATEASDLAIQQYRVMSVTNESPNTYRITATFHDPAKFARVDTGARVEPPPITVIPPSVMPVPQNVMISSYSSVEQGLAVTVLRATWDAVENAVAYEAEWRRDDGPWVTAGRTSSLGFEVPGIYAGRYVVRVRSINVLGAYSLPGTSLETVLAGKTDPPPAPVGFSAASLVFGIRLSWGFPAGAGDTLKTEIEYGETSAVSSFVPLGEFAHPSDTHTLMGLSAGKRLWFRARLIDKSGNVGPWTSVITGTASTDAGDILDYIEGQIGESALAPDLLADIETIPALEQGLQQAGAAITAETQARQEADSALARQITEISASAGIRSYRQSTAPTGPDLKTGSIWYDTSSGNKPHRWSGTAWQPVDDGRIANNAAAIQQEAQTRADEVSALAQSTQTLQSEVDGVRTSVQQTSTALTELDGELKAAWSIKTEVNNNGMKYAAGMTLGVTGTGSQTQSQVLFLADRFAIMHSANGAGTAFTAPFAVQGGQVFIKSAVIGNASIGSAKLSDWLESDAKGPGGVPVLRLNFRTGEIQINSAQVGGWRMAMNNNGMRLYDENDTLRVSLGR